MARDLTRKLRVSKRAKVSRQEGREVFATKRYSAACSATLRRAAAATRRRARARSTGPRPATHDRVRVRWTGPGAPAGTLAVAWPAPGCPRPGHAPGRPPTALSGDAGGNTALA